MLKKVLAVCQGHEITAQFLDESEYDTYCKKIMSASLDIALKNLSLDEIIDLWQQRNCDCADEISGSVEAVNILSR